MAIREYEKYPIEKRREFFRDHFPEAFPLNPDDREYERMADCLHMIAAYIVEAVEAGEFKFTPIHIHPEYRTNPRPLLHDWVVEDLEEWIA